MPESPATFDDTVLVSKDCDDSTHDRDFTEVGTKA